MKYSRITNAEDYKCQPVFWQTHCYLPLYSCHEDCPQMSEEKFIRSSLAKKQSRKTNAVKRTVCDYGNN